MNNLIPTDKLYLNLNNDDFHGQFIKYRKMMDYTYYTNYTLDRQIFQDEIINRYIKKSVKKVHHPQLIFTCGCFGAGKSHCIKHLSRIGKLDINNYIYIDPDRIKYELIEARHYIAKDPVNAGSLLHMESTYISLLLQYVCFDAGYQMIVDGSMRETAWFISYIKWINVNYTQYIIGIIQVKADLDIVLQRCHKRGKSTGRIISPDLIKNIHSTIQSSFDTLKFKVDFYMVIDNNSQTQIIEFVENKQN